jgi:2-C-methyl-D-erythritol 4-phosphate cytidylyltransferase
VNSRNAIIVAAGKGTRLRSQIPKQFLGLCGKPVLLHTLESFFAYDANINIILVLAKTEFETWREIAEKYNFNKSITLSVGGATRFQSVKQGLQKITDNGLVAIHDGVRPLVTSHIIAASFDLAEKMGSAVASVPLKESIRQTDKTASKAVDRANFRLIQTPQTFDVELIKKAYELPEDESLTDDASVAERAGHQIALFEGSYENIKITTPEDLVVAEAIMKTRTGL